jgi:hypothetical protein
VAVLTAGALTVAALTAGVLTGDVPKADAHQAGGHREDDVRPPACRRGARYLDCRVDAVAPGGLVSTADRPGRDFGLAPTAVFLRDRGSTADPYLCVVDDRPAADDRYEVPGRIHRGELAGRCRVPRVAGPHAGAA